MHEFRKKTKTFRYFQQPPQQFIVQQSSGPNKTAILNQNVVFINQSGQQQIIASNQQQGNNVGECVEHQIGVIRKKDKKKPSKLCILIFSFSQQL